MTTCGNDPSIPNEESITCITRRTALLAGGLGLGGVVAWTTHRLFLARREPVFVASGQTYRSPLSKTIREGLLAVGFSPTDFARKRVLLKPNMVEPARDRPQMTTHPAVVAGAIDVFRSWSAEVHVGEAPGHVRDSGMALCESGIHHALRDSRIRFDDLNYQPSRWFPNRGGLSTLKGLYFPEGVYSADWIVSLPKLKTHHWMGLTASMKNLYGVLPGCKYGWPKNVLHHAGIPETVVDIAASTPRTLAIVDAIDCMEGDGPILGTCKTLGLLAVGRNLTAVDATLARIAGLIPQKIPYLKLASGRLGPTADGQIEQRGEPWQRLVQPFQVLDVPHLRAMQASTAVSLTHVSKSTNGSENS